MKLFHLIFVYIMLGSPGPVNKGLSSCQSGYVCVCVWGGGGGRGLSLEERRLLTTLWSSQYKVCGEKSIVGEGVGVGLQSRQKAKRSSG